MNISAHSNEPLVSVLILAFNSHLYLSDTIRSVRDQTCTNWEIVIVQDGNDPKVTEVIRPWLELDARIRHFHRPVPGNIGNALNYGMARCQGEFVAILDDDDTWINPRKLELQISFLASHPEIIGVGGGAAVADRNGHEVMRYLKPISPEDCKARALIANPVIHSTLMFRKQAVCALGGYDESLPDCQDWDLVLKIMHQGRLANLPEYLVAYRVWDGGRSSRKIRSCARSALRIVNRHRKHFDGYAIVFPTTVAFLLFTLLPNPIVRHSYQHLTRIKKWLFSRRHD